MVCLKNAFVSLSTLSEAAGYSSSRKYISASQSCTHRTIAPMSTNRPLARSKLNATTPSEGISRQRRSMGGGLGHFRHEPHENPATELAGLRTMDTRSLAYPRHESRMINIAQLLIPTANCPA